uniref:YGGT family protein n=2 Tax=Salix viminalis TaxID=40686 RepID=A0A6N2NFE9_SALVM
MEMAPLNENCFVEKNSKCKAPSFVPNSMVLLSSSILQNPLFLRPPVRQNPSIIMGEFHNSITSATEKCLSRLHSFASQIPFLKKIVTDFNQHITQIQCGRDCYRRNMNSSSLSNHNFAAVLPGDSMTGLVLANGVLNFLNIYNTLLVARLVLTWFPNSPPAIVNPLSTLCDPYLNIFRGIIPPLGGTLDLSPILAFLVLNAFTSTAAALPAELPENGATPRSRSSPTMFTHLTTAKKKWMRRLHGNESKSSPGSI